MVKIEGGTATGADEELEVVLEGGTTTAADEELVVEI